MLCFSAANHPTPHNHENQQIRAAIEAGNVVVHWTGGVPLQSADTLAGPGPWTTVNGATSPYTPPAGGTKFYRPQIP